MQPAGLRPATSEDHAQIAALQTRHGLEAESYEEWTHQWANNPAYAENLGHWPIGWVLETGDGEIVGYLGNIPLAYELDDRRLNVMTGRGWVTDRRYRVQSLGLLNESLRQKYADLFVYSSAGPSTSRVLEAYGLSRVPVGSWDKSVFWITNYTGVGASLLAMKMPAAPRIAAYPAGAALFIADQFRRRPHVFTIGPEVTTCSSFDERFDDFWHRLKTQRRNLLLAVRTREVLNWHFKFPLCNKTLWIATILDTGAIVAYAIFLRQDVSRLGLKRVRLIDCHSLIPNKELFVPLLLWALDRCRKERIHLLEHVGLSLGPKIVQDMAPHVHTLPSWRYFYRATDKSLGQILRNPDVWNPSLFDGDSSL
jgi:hypothetical protein